MIYQYKCKFYLNATHYIIINNKPGRPHSHCFEIVLDMGTKDTDNFIQFNAIEKKVEDILSIYQEKLINEVEPFDKLNPTLENMCEYFKRLFFKEVKNIGWTLLTIEMSETPSRAFIQNIIEEKIEKDIANKNSLISDIEEVNKAIAIVNTGTNVSKAPVKEAINSDYNEGKPEIRIKSPDGFYYRTAKKEKEEDIKSVKRVKRIKKQEDLKTKNNDNITNQLIKNDNQDDFPWLVPEHLLYFDIYNDL